MKGTVELVDGVHFTAQSGTGHSISTDGPEESGGRNNGMRPMEAVLLGMGGCSAYDVVEMLRKRRREPTSLKLELEAERDDKIPKVFTHIHLKYIVSGERITDRDVARAIELSIEKYCSATKMLSSTAKITYEYDLLDE